MANLFGWKRRDGTRRYREAGSHADRWTALALALATALTWPVWPEGSDTITIVRFA